ncbi:hydrolase, alpha/beta domain protein [Teladorsagia circumcincta]|uniref:Hydrolase, alpha/beta domain protein n=1 Tax=Teladorsagia circumcincta TaxID=45464 RepID=A0A2G9V1I6_TELCI|nr:hydrolase, alpha/beta domain protein [Teladorsagia circumcincta]
MWWSLVYWITALLFILFALFYLYIPMPAEIGDRRHVIISDMFMRIVWEYPVRVYIPHKRQSRGALVFIHGGGWVAVKTEFYDTLITTLMLRLKVTVFSVDYRLAPEHPFPAPVDDCEAVVKDLHENSYEKFDIDRDKICIAGDSAGGNLAAVVTQRFARRNEHFIKDEETHLEAFASKGTDPDVSPLFGVRKDLPPTMVATAEFDVLR